jgi:hypothetical protein
VQRTDKTLFAIVEQGGYPDFRSLYAELGYQTTLIANMRKALLLLRQHPPDVVVAEFNFQSDFRDRTSSLESLLATLQRLPTTKLIVLYDREQAHRLALLQSPAAPFQAIPFPVERTLLQRALTD